MEFFIYFQGSPCTPDRPVSQFGFLKPPAHLVFENGKGAMVDIPSTAPKELPAVSRVKLPWTKPVLDSRMAFWHSRGLLFRIFLPSSGVLLLRSIRLQIRKYCVRLQSTGLRYISCARLPRQTTTNPFRKREFNARLPRPELQYHGDLHRPIVDNRTRS